LATSRVCHEETDELPGGANDASRAERGQNVDKWGGVCDRCQRGLEALRSTPRVNGMDAHTLSLDDGRYATNQRGNVVEPKEDEGKKKDTLPPATDDEATGHYPWDDYSWLNRLTHAEKEELRKKWGPAGERSPG
jgi:hypothetical protein